MQELLDRLALCIELGKCDLASPYPPDLVGREGASEIIVRLLESGVHPNDIVSHAMTVGMNRVGDRFAEGKVFIPQLLLAARAMKTAMAHLKPFFESGVAVHRGTIIIGTVAGDLHDIGKNIVGMVMEGDGWRVIDMGVDVPADKFASAAVAYPQSVVALSALLTTTMGNMKQCVSTVKGRSPLTPVFVGGAPVTGQFSKTIGADGYFPDPGSFAKHLAACNSSNADH